MANERKVVPTDGRGILAGDYLNEDRPMTRTQWLEEVFPEWGTFLNQQIENFEVPAGRIALWWLGGPSWVVKTTAGGIFFVDVYSGPSLYTSYYYCGVCKMSGADSIDWLRLNPQVIDPWKLKRLDGVFCTHMHQDHCDIYTIKAALQTSDCKFYAPPVAAQKLRKFGVPEDRLVVFKNGDEVSIPGGKVVGVRNYDATAIKTGTDSVWDWDDAAVSFLFQSEGNGIGFLGDTHYHNGYADVGAKYDIDVAIFDMGHNAPGATDKMTPYDAFRVGESIRAKVLIPDHYDNWANTAGDPDLLAQQLERITKENAPHIKTVILRTGARYLHPDDQNIGRYKYPDWRERYRAEKSWEYGTPDKDA